MLIYLFSFYWTSSGCLNWIAMKIMQEKYSIDLLQYGSRAAMEIKNLWRLNSLDWTISEEEGRYIHFLFGIFMRLNVFRSHLFHIIATPMLWKKIIHSIKLFHSSVGFLLANNWQIARISIAFTRFIHYFAFKVATSCVTACFNICLYLVP